MKIRIKFKKEGAMKFVGHLDVMRYFQKAIRRADIDICYSAGFNPHQIMSFAAPLGIGITSEGEYMDIEVNSTDSSKEMVNKLNSCMVDGFTIISYRELPEESKNAMSIVAAADYELTFREGYEPEDKAVFFEGLQKFYNQEEINIIKKTKKSEMEMNIRPLIYKLEVKDDVIFMQVSTGSVSNLKPELVMQAYYDSLGMELHPFTFKIHRLELYANKNMKEEDAPIELVTLESLGDEVE